MKLTLKRKKKNMEKMKERESNNNRKQYPINSIERLNQLVNTIAVPIKAIKLEYLQKNKRNKQHQNIRVIKLRS